MESLLLSRQFDVQMEEEIKFEEEEEGNEGKKSLKEVTRSWPSIGHIIFADEPPNCHANGLDIIVKASEGI